MLRMLSRVGFRPVQRVLTCSQRGLAQMDAGDEETQSGRYEKSLNQVNLLGRLGRDAELRGTEAHPVVVFSMATNSVFSRPGSGGTTSRVDWHRVSVFKPGLREKVAMNLKKGDRVFVAGMIRYDEFSDSEQNLVRTTTILASDIINLTKRYLEEEGVESEERGF